MFREDGSPIRNEKDEPLKLGFWAVDFKMAEGDAR